MKKQFLILIALAFATFSLQAQEASVENEEQQQEEASQEEDDELGFSISGTGDVYFRSNLNADYDVAPGTSFANLPGFSLGMANVVLAQDGAKAGVTADLVFGPRGEDATFLSSTLRPGDANSSSIVNQLYAYYNISDNVTATLGNFNTFLGYEVISPAGNFNYSTSYMFSYGPFSHTGLKLDAALSDEFSVMGGVFNLTDETEYNFSNDYAYGVQLGYSKGIASVYLNGLFADGYSQGDITAGFDVAENTYLGVNATVADDLFSGVAGYLQQTLSDSFALGARAEYFKDDGLGLFTTDESVLDLTLSGNIFAGNLTLIPEIRVDSFSEDGLIPNDDEFNDGLSSFLLGAYYSF